MRDVAIRIAALTVAILAVAFLPSSPAYGCSCIEPDAEQLFNDSDGAFVGRLVEAPSFSGGFVSSADLAPYVFEVEAAYKGEITNPMTVMSAISGASCGLEMPEGASASVFVWSEGEAWHGGLCSTMGPEALLDGPFEAIEVSEAEQPAGTSVARWALAGLGVAGAAAAGAAYRRNRKPTI